MILRVVLSHGTVYKQLSEFRQDTLGMADSRYSGCIPAAVYKVLTGQEPVYEPDGSSDDPPVIIGAAEGILTMDMVESIPEDAIRCKGSSSVWVAYK